MNLCVYIKTFGCKVNQYNSEMIKENLIMDNKFKFANNYKDADLFIVNSCFVTENAEKEVLKEVRKFSKLGKVIITGCFNRKLNIENVYILNLNEENEIREFIYKIYNISLDEKFYKDKIEKFSNRTRAFVKIEEGCNKFCSYCIVPYLRGRARSRNIDNIIDEVKILIENGYKEIVLTGTELGYFGIEKGINIVELLKKLISINKNFRIRLSSIDPEFFSDELIYLMKENSKICPHIHLPLQSGSDKILKKMRRGYDISYYIDRVNFFKKNVTNGTITTDIIVGFPYEEDDDFENTIKILEEVKFLKCHIFPYSRREGTLSSKYEFSVSKDIVNERLKIIKEVANRVRKEVIKSFINKELILLTENKINGKLFGFTENYIRVFIDGEFKVNNFYKVYLQNTENNVEYGIVLNEFCYPTIKGGEIKECQQFIEEKVKI
ncbi:MAG: tRNA (N(6)-L-threonylcarbamoyladenosine(37)-C(2))-methylthiotransferase MtaB [Caldisericia bacterium]